VTEHKRYERRSTLAIVGLLVAVLLGVVADLATKAWAIDNLSGRRITPPAGEVCVPSESGFLQMDRVRQPPVVLVDGFFELRYAENCGAAFGFMNTWSSMAKRLVFIPVALGAVLVLGFMYVTGRGGRFLMAAVPLIIAGAIGNFVDRVRYGYVVDFIRFFGDSPGWLEWALGPRWEYPTFNVADIEITLGVAFLLVDGWLEGRRERLAAARVAAIAPSAPEDGEPSASDEAPEGGDAGDEIDDAAAPEALAAATEAPAVEAPATEADDVELLGGEGTRTA
jgi:signal peptidase II